MVPYKLLNDRPHDFCDVFAAGCRKGCGWVKWDRTKNLALILISVAAPARVVSQVAGDVSTHQNGRQRIDLAHKAAFCVSIMRNRPSAIYNSRFRRSRRTGIAHSGFLGFKTKPKTICKNGMKLCQAGLNPEQARGLCYEEGIAML